MSKITPKNLHYDTTLPPFLARLQAQNATSDGRHEFALARPKKTRTADEEAEDEPVYFDEGSGETLTKGEWEAREAEETEILATDEHKGGTEAEGKSTGDKEAGKETGKEKVAAIGGKRKRVVGKVVGGEGEERPVSSAAKEEKKIKVEDPAKKSEKPKAGKKAKKIKLSFDD